MNKRHVDGLTPDHPEYPELEAIPLEEVTPLLENVAELMKSVERGENPYVNEELAAAQPHSKPFTWLSRGDCHLSINPSGPAGKLVGELTGEDSGRLVIEVIRPNLDAQDVFSPSIQEQLLIRMPPRSGERILYRQDEGASPSWGYFWIAEAARFAYEEDIKRDESSTFGLRRWRRKQLKNIRQSLKMTNARIADVRSITNFSSIFLD